MCDSWSFILVYATVNWSVTAVMESSSDLTFWFSSILSSFKVSIALFVLSMNVFMVLLLFFTVVVNFLRSAFTPFVTSVEAFISFIRSSSVTAPFVSVFGIIAVALFSQPKVIFVIWCTDVVFLAGVYVHVTISKS